MADQRESSSVLDDPARVRVPVSRRGTASPPAAQAAITSLAEGALSTDDMLDAIFLFPRDIPRLPRSWIEDTYSNLIHYGEADKSGHFAALEQPEILVSEIRTGLRTLRS